MDIQKYILEKKISRKCIKKNILKTKSGGKIIETMLADIEILSSKIYGCTNLLKARIGGLVEHKEMLCQLLFS